MRNRIAVILALAGLGGFTVPAQICLLREFLSLFSSNEMALGSVMGMWLLFTGAGAWLARILPGKKGSEPFTLFLMFLLSSLPLLTLFMAGIWKSEMIPYGTMAGLWQIVSAATLVLLPLCLVNGYLFVFLTSRLRETEGDAAPGNAYAIESLGGLFGGAAVNFILLWFVGSYTSLRILTVLFVVFILVYAFLQRQSRYVLFSILAGAILTACILVFPFRQMTSKALYREQEIVMDKESPYGRVTITRSGEQLNYYSDGTFLFSSGNTIWNEESVHYALLQRPNPAAVLLIGGGISGTIEEILKYQPGRIDYAEINPVLADLARAGLAHTGNDTVFIHRQDARAFLKTSQTRYDFILVNVPEPSSLQLNRYYTVEFAVLLERHLTPSGVVSFSLASTADYVSPEAGKMNSVLYRTLNHVFGNVIIIPGTRNWYLASNDSLSPGIAGIADRRMAGNQYVNGFYIDDRLLESRAGFILKNLTQKGTINHDFHPVIYHHQISIWLSQYGIRWQVVTGAVAVLFLVLLLLLNRTGAGLFTAGFTGASLEVMAILAIQVALGYMISMAGIVIMTFMAGLAAGPWLSRKVFKIPGQKSFVMLSACMTALPFLMFGIVKIIESNATGTFVLMVLILAMTLAASLILAMQYTVATSIAAGDRIRATSRNYASDLFGSALGAFLVPVVFVPVIGIGWALLVLVAMNLVTTLLSTIKPTHVKNR